MHSPIIRKTATTAGTSAVVELGGTRHLFAAVASQRSGGFEGQTCTVLQTIDTIARDQGVRDSIVQQTVFLADFERLDDCRRMKRDFYGPQLPATSYVAQAPCGGESLAVEIIGIDASRDDVDLQRPNERAAIVRRGRMTWAHVANVRPETASPAVYDRSLDAFRHTKRELAALGFGFERVVRTWLYLGHIVEIENGVPRYQNLNLARTDFFRDHRFLGDGTNRVCYPASTGIGAADRDVMMSCLALATDRSDVIRLPLENPRQVAAHDYDQRYGRQSPKFTRAMAIVEPGAATVFVSGTASIIDSESRHLDDVARQTQETLDNMAALISHDNFRRHGQPNLGATLDDFAIIRAYVKRKEDYPIVRDVCRARLGDVPIIYTVADLCRDELLVEIEGIAFCRVV